MHSFVLSGNFSSLRSILALPLLLLCFVIVTVAQPQGSNSPDSSSRGASRSATLRGRIVYEDNGLPVRHTVVTSFNLESLEEGPSGITDRRGEFELKRLPPGDYILDVDAPDVIGLEMLAMTTIQNSATSDQIPSGQAISLDKSQREYQRLMALFLNKISFAGREDSRVEIRVKRAGAISGKVRYADGSPAANMSVEIFSKQGDRYVPMLLESIHGGYNLKPEKTDSLGRYRITGLLPGEYVLSVTEPSANKGDEFSTVHDVQSLLVTFYPSATHIKQAQAIQVQLAHETSGVEIVLSERDLRTLTGTLKTQRGDHPVAGAIIFLFGKDAAKKPAMTGGVLHTQSDEEGRWAFYEVPDGQYVIQFSPDSGANEAWSSGNITRPQNFVELKRDIILTGDSLSELAIKVATGGRLSGTVIVEGDQKFPGVHLILRSSNGAPLLNGQAFGTRPDFSFVVSGVVSEDLEITVTAPMPGYYTKSVTLNGAPLPQPFKVADGDNITGIRIVLAPLQ